MTDKAKRLAAKRAAVPAGITGMATPERIEYLRQCFPKEPWLEVYRDKRPQFWPDREGGVTDADLEEIIELPGGYSEWLRLTLWREFSRVRWREWIETHNEVHCRDLHPRIRCGDANEVRRRGERYRRQAERTEAVRQRQLARSRAWDAKHRKARESATSGPCSASESISSLFE